MRGVGGCDADLDCGDGDDVLLAGRCGGDLSARPLAGFAAGATIWWRESHPPRRCARGSSAAAASGCSGDALGVSSASTISWGEGGGGGGGKGEGEGRGEGQHWVVRRTRPEGRLG